MANNISPLFVGCPIHENKEYAIQRWMDSVSKIDAPEGKVVRLYDFTESNAIVDRWSKAAEAVGITIIPVGHIDTVSSCDELVGKMNRTMEIMRQDFLAGSYSAWLNVEIDVMVPSDIYTFLLGALPDGDWVCHGYPARNGPVNHYQSGFGCTLFSKRLMLENHFCGLTSEYSDGAIWQMVRSKPYAYRVADIWGFRQLEHIDL